MGYKVKNTGGITLIALIITIIVLLILAGVSIAMLTGQNGILTQAQNAKQATEGAAAKEKVEIAVVGAISKDKTGALTIDNLKTEMANYEGTIEGSKFPVTVKVDNKMFEVSENGNVREKREIAGVTPEISLNIEDEIDGNKIVEITVDNANDIEGQITFKYYAKIENSTNDYELIYSGTEQECVYEYNPYYYTGKDIMVKVEAITEEGNIGTQMDKYYVTTDYGSFVVKQPTMISGSNEKKIRARRLTDRRLERYNEEIRKQIERINGDETYSVKDIYQAITGNDEEEVETENGTTINLTEYNMVMPVYELALLDAERKITYDVTEDVEIKQQIELMKELYYEDDNIILMCISPETGETVFLDIYDYDAITGEFTATFPYLGAVAVLIKEE